MKSTTTRLARRRATNPDHRADAAADLAAYTSPADLLELAAILGRYHDDEVADVRDLVRWTPAA